MNLEPKDAWRKRLLGWADDEMVLAHRNSEWTGHGPILEEDIAFTNIALDEMGHASLWYRLVAQIDGEHEESYPDQLVFRREPEEYRNVQMVELPNGDWGFSLMRQYLFDLAEMVRLAELVDSPVGATAVKIQREEIYHLRHTGAWVRRLGLGTEESNMRTQRALDQLWPYALQLWEVGEDAELRERWEQEARSHLRACELRPPEETRPSSSSRSDHTPHLAQLLVEMQEVARLETNVTW